MLSVSRRTMLQRLALLLATLVGAVVPASAMAAVPAGSADRTPRTFTLYGRNWHTLGRGRVRGELARSGDRLSFHGELLFHEDGEQVGDFLAACFCPEIPASFGNVAAVTMEMHTFTLPDGSLMGQGIAAPGGGGRFAVVGGTGKYAGARGFYTALQEPLEWGGTGRAEFVFELLD